MGPRTASRRAIGRQLIYPFLLLSLPSCFLLLDVNGGDFFISGTLFDDCGCLGLRDGDTSFELHDWDGPIPSQGTIVFLRVRTIRGSAPACTFGQVVDVIEVVRIDNGFRTPPDPR